jgi:hypothetical protein
MLLERATDVPPPGALPAVTSRRAKGRRFVTGGGALAIIVAIAVAGFSVAGALGREDQFRPVAPVPKVSARFTVGPDVSDLAYGFGSLWYATSNALLRVNPSTGKVIATIDDFPRETSPDSGIGSATNRIAIGSGAVWLLVADNGSRSGPVATSSTQTSGPGNRRGFRQSAQTSITSAPPGFVEHWALIRVDPKTNDARASALVFDSMPNGVTVDRGSVWVAAGSFGRTGGASHGLVARFDAKTMKIRSTFEFEAQPTHIFAEGGMLWVNKAGSAGRIFRIDPQSGRQLASISLRSPGDIVLVGDVLWATTYSETHWAVAAFDKRTLRPWKTVQLGKKPEFFSELVSAGNRLWVIDLFPGTLRWIDPDSGRRSEPAERFVFPAHIAAGDGVLWTAGGATNEGTIWRVNLP